MFSLICRHNLHGFAWNATGFLLMHYAAWKTGRPKLAKIFWYLWLIFSFIHMIVVYIMELAKGGGASSRLIKIKGNLVYIQKKAMIM